GQRAAARAAEPAWALAAGQDLRYPEAEGRAPGPVGALMTRYSDRLMHTATLRRGACRAFLGVLSLSAGQTAAMRPDVMASVLNPVRPDPLQDPPFTPEERSRMIALFTRG
ncbi:MAG: pyridine nucleotide-disulfide oxidoreductase, partial [Streptomyces sp.]|nr:pyridine nucleotide-disulfide oxidoreductase [Streptomyces sp.]